MSIKQQVASALDTVIHNSWAVELPNNPVWPAIVFDIDTKPEEGWVVGGGYERHTVSIIILARSLTEVSALHSQVRAAMKNCEVYLEEGDHGDAEYEADASVYAYFCNHVVRTRR